MTDTQITWVVGGAVVVIVVFLLRDKIFSLSANKDGFKLDNKQPEQKHGVVVEDAKAHEGSIDVENNAGDGVTAKKLDAKTDIRATNNPAPKP